jgi:hypothetical protein
METKNNAARSGTLETQGSADSDNKGNTFSEPAKTFSEKFRIVDGQLQFFHEGKGIWMPCDAVPDGNCREYRTRLDGTLEEIECISQTPNTNNVSDELLADMNLPGYDPFGGADAHEEPVNESISPNNNTFSLDDFRVDMEKNLLECKETAKTKEKKIGLFLVRTANQCMRDAEATPVPRDLYPPLPGLIFESEITIQFGNTVIGKSALAVQIACHMDQTDISGVFGF